MPEARPLALADLEIRFGDRTLVRGVSLEVWPGELVGLVGASGSGKTLTCRSLLGLVDARPGVVAADLAVPVGPTSVRPYAGLTPRGMLQRRRDRSFRGIRGRVVGYLPQDAPAALDPLRRVGGQVRRAAALDPDRRRVGGGDPADAVPWLVGAGFSISEARRVERLYPHQLSGGMAQRVAIAQVLARGSRFLVADEPMTGLDATIQRRLVGRLRQLADQGLGVLVVTHDLSLISGVADRILLMDGGRIVEGFGGDALDAETATTDAGRALLAAAARRGWG